MAETQTSSVFDSLLEELAGGRRGPAPPRGSLVSQPSDIDCPRSSPWPFGVLSRRRGRETEAGPPSTGTPLAGRARRSTPEGYLDSLAQAQQASHPVPGRWFASPEDYLTAHPWLKAHVQTTMNRLLALFPTESRLELRVEPAEPEEPGQEQKLFLAVWTGWSPEDVAPIFDEIDNSWGIHLAIETEGRLNVTVYFVQPSALRVEGPDGTGTATGSM